MVSKNDTSELSLVVRNIDELEKGLPKAGTKLLMHLTKAQWAAMSQGIDFTDAPLKQGIAFRFIPLTDGSGGIGEVQCMPGECEECSVRATGSPDGTIVATCRCKLGKLCTSPKSTASMNKVVSG
jgi:hypothetical protein